MVSTDGFWRWDGGTLGVHGGVHSRAAALPPPRYDGFAGLLVRLGGWAWVGRGDGWVMGYHDICIHILMRGRAAGRFGGPGVDEAMPLWHRR